MDIDQQQNQDGYFCLKRYGRKGLLSSFLRCRSGIAGVEAAMIMPFLIVFLFGCIEFSRSLFIQSELQRAVSLTTRFVMLNPDTAVDDMKTELTSNLDTVDSDQITSVDAVRQTDEDGNNVVQLSVIYSFTFLIPFLSSEPIQLTATQSVVTS